MRWRARRGRCPPQVTAKNLIKLASYDNGTVMEGVLGGAGRVLSEEQERLSG